MNLSGMFQARHLKRPASADPSGKCCSVLTLTKTLARVN
jgi:hypothetical protein